jgi:opacity protein-like surface antigen
MKKASALAVIALMGGMAAHAQDTKKFRLGLELCPNLGWISSDDKSIKNDGTRLGFRFGLLGDVMLGSNANYYFSTGAFLNSVGAKTLTTTADSLPAVKGEVKLQYVEFPLSIKLKTNEIGYMTYFGQIGFDLGINVSAKASYADSDFVNVSDDTNLLRMALLVGGGVEYNFSGNTSALLGLKYSNGFTSVNDGDGPDARLHYFEITVGALF